MWNLEWQYGYATEKKTQMNNKYWCVNKKN